MKQRRQFDSSIKYNDNQELVTIDLGDETSIRYKHRNEDADQ